MKWVVLLIAMVIGLAGCSGQATLNTASADDSPPPTEEDSPPPTEELVSGENDDGPSAEMMAAAILQLVTEDHTFGQGPPPFTEYLIQTRLDPFAGDPTSSGEEERLALTDEERAGIEDVVAVFGPVRWIDDPTEWQTGDLRPTIEGAVILGVGEPLIGDTSGLVPVSLWCGGRCGKWLTYRLELVDGNWEVTGTEGPITIS